jgi:protein TonB
VQLECARRRHPSVSGERERLRHEGTASIECEVDASGLVTSARVIRSAGCEDLDHAALEAVRAARFRPATEGGVRVASRVVQPVNFVLPAAR